MGINGSVLEVINMLGKMVLFCRTLTTRLVLSSKRFPEAIFLASSVVAILIFKNHMENILSRDRIEFFSRISMILALGIPLSLSIRAFFEKRHLLSVKYKIVTYVLAIVGLSLYYIFLLKDLHMTSYLRYIAVTISLYSMFAFIPYFYKKQNYEIYIVKLLGRFFITYLYSMILYAGLMAMLFTIHKLFLIEISNNIYFDICLIVLGTFVPTFFLGDIPKNNEELEPSCYPKTLKILLLYIVMPLLTAYSVTLYVYFAKILLTMQWPEGIVSNLVMWYTMIGIVVIFSIYPLRDENHLVKKFIRFFSIFVLPLLAMMFVALGIRINAYGITENRYFSLLIGLWILGCMVYFIAKKHTRMIVLPISVAILSLLSVVGPWNCFSVSALSQTMRFEKILMKYNIIEDGKINKIVQGISPDDKKEILNIISYFVRRQNLSDLKYLPQDFNTDQMKSVFGFSFDDNGKKYFDYNVKENGNLLDIKDCDYFFYVYATGEADNVKKSEMPIYATYTYKNQEIMIIKMDQVIYRGDLNAIATKIRNDIKANNKNIQPLKRDDMMFTDENENVKVVYVFKRIGGAEEAGKNVIMSIDFSLLIKVKNPI
jgi:hypothetical protein